LAAPKLASARSAADPASGPLDLTVGRVGADGDGIAALADGVAVFIADSLPGEVFSTGTLTRRGQGWVAPEARLLAPSPDRQTPPCPHFGPCGGCTLQHWADAPYADWKAGQLRAALIRAGFADPPLGALARTPPAARRRIDLALQRDGERILVGLHQRRGRAVVDMHACPILHPRLFALVGALRGVLPRIAGFRKAGSAVANLLDSGIDLLLRTDSPLQAEDRVRLTDLARAVGACRLSWADEHGPRGGSGSEPACTLDSATTMLAGVTVAPPPAAFLQASREGEAAITAAVLAGLPAALPRKARIVELFAGCGTLTFALAERARVVAYEGDPAAHDTIRRAIAGRRIEAILRDLARQPLTAKDLAGAAAIVLDPPFGGALAQLPAVAASGVPRVIYVSCNPAALSRDARMLSQAGYAIAAATPIDQFLWSSNVESVTVFTR